MLLLKRVGRMDPFLVGGRGPRQGIERQAQALAAFEPEAMQQLIFRSAELHMNHIASSGDPFESGSARQYEVRDPDQFGKDEAWRKAQ